MVADGIIGLQFLGIGETMFYALGSWTFLQVTAATSLISIGKFPGVSNGVFPAIAAAEKLEQPGLNLSDAFNG